MPHQGTLRLSSTRPGAGVASNTDSDLLSLLHRVFGHTAFRAHQESVCKAAATGRDVLLVMPTGAGKSLCYQLPALARRGTALVVSPLIALMDDQAMKLSSLGLRVARIHSGLPREDMRAASRAYLEGELDFLFIAPERLRVPGFPEMLARRKPALVAIDEAHCISQWGHDFRPDYRTLGQFLPALRPAPIIALTATATPAVQQDILRALNLEQPAVFITGFRRDNLHIEIQETSKPQRIGVIRKLLTSAEAKPAIIYAQSRKAAEEVAASLQDLSAAAYHAGLDAATRDRVQRAFLEGKLQVVVATVAFGMGVDKANVRTVVHAALPGSVEAYYQEIGRAGRDGKPSRAILLHSFADRRTQEFLLEKNYPSSQEMERVLGALANGLETLPELQTALKMDREVLEQSIDKLLIQGAIAADLDGRIRAMSRPDWRSSYEEQIAYRRAQVDKIVAYAEGSTCRMSALVRHFGDATDTGKPCGLCDVCRPEGTSASVSHQPTASELADLRQILHTLNASARSAGKVFADLRWKDRKHFDRLTEALSKAGLVALSTDVFRTEDGRDITYRKLSLTADGANFDEAALSTVWLQSGDSDQPLTRKGKEHASSNRRTSTPEAEQPLTAEEIARETRLKEWRLATARASGIPPFAVFHDSVLRALAKVSPQNVRELESVRGIGPEKSNRYGAELLALCKGESFSQGTATSSRPSSPGKAQDPKQAAVPRATVLTRSETAALHQSRRRATPDLPQVTLRRTPVEAVFTPEQTALVDRLKGWRSEVAGAAGLPSFFVLSDTLLQQIACLQPRSMGELESLNMLGRDKLQEYGAALIEVCRTTA